jgi:hypothetical protein
MFPDLREPEILQTVSAIPNSEAYDSASLQIEERSRVLWQTDRHNATSLLKHLLNDRRTRIGDSILQSVLHSAQLDEVLAAENTVPGLTASMIRANHAAAASPDVWQHPNVRHNELFDAVASSSDLTPALQDAIVAALLEARCAVLASRCVSTFGDRAVAGILSWFDSQDFSSPRDFDESWRAAIASRPAAMFEWLEACQAPRDVTFALIADLSDPHSEAVHARGADPWLKPIRTWCGTIASAARIRLDAFRLALGFDNPGPRADELVAASFATVHAAASARQLGSDSWAWLENRLPELSWTRNWDSCERLRRGVIEQIVRNNWNLQVFLRCFPDHESQRVALKSCEKTDGGEWLLKRLSSAVRSGSIELAIPVTHWVTTY